jgi:hypothetical protein
MIVNTLIKVCTRTALFDVEFLAKENPPPKNSHPQIFASDDDCWHLHKSNLSGTRLKRTDANHSENLRSNPDLISLYD